jgi:hypothetical protein
MDPQEKARNQAAQELQRAGRKLADQAAEMLASSRELLAEADRLLAPKPKKPKRNTKLLRTAE